MIHSEDEDDFLSADEDAFDNSDTSRTKSTINVVDLGKEPKQITIGKDKVSESVSRKDEKETAADRPSSDVKFDEPCIDAPVSSGETKEKESASLSHKSDVLKVASKLGHNAQEDDEDDDEEALAERIRERNLKIARKFSAEIAKNIKSSAPIPVKLSQEPRTSQRVKPRLCHDAELPIIPEPEAIESSSKLSTSFSPPAPPPTPAIASSLSQLGDATLMDSQLSYSQTPHFVIHSSSGQPASPMTYQLSASSGEPTKDSTRIADKSQTEQARSALDRLSETLDRSDQSKNLLEKVAADIKKVTIKSDDQPDNTGSLDPISAAIPSISELGSTISGWGWSSATKLLSTASQATSQVGSVLDSVVKVSQNVPAEESTDRSAGQQGSSSAQEPGEQEKSTRLNYEDMHDPLVDFTLNAMESLGKRAFGVMTKRDESGSIQIKGLGRPWERLLNITNASTGQNDDKHTSSLEPDDGKLMSEHKKTTGKHSKERLPVRVDDPEEYAPTKTDDKPVLPPTLKNRKRRVD